MKSHLAGFAFLGGLGFVAVGLCCSVEGEELRGASLVLEALLTSLCTVLVSSVHSLPPQAQLAARL